MSSDKRPDLLPLIQSSLNNSPSPERGNVSLITAFTEMEPSPPISTSMRLSTASPIAVSNIQKELTMNIEELKSKITELHLIVQQSLQSNRKIGQSLSRGELSEFQEDDLVLVGNTFILVKNVSSLQRSKTRH